MYHKSILVGVFMHTFFINTSGKNLEIYSDIFEIQHETRRLISLECPLAEWTDSEKGYKACVRRMGELIDSYKDINNDFNLILYVDLLSYEIYTSLPLNKHRERYACLKALRSVLKHYIKETFVDEMNECGRVPKEVLIIFEENQLPKDGDERTEDGKNLIRSYSRLVLGLPSDAEIDRIIQNTDDSDDETVYTSRLREQIFACDCSCVGKSVLTTYLEQVDIFARETRRCTTYENAVRQLLDRIIDCAFEDDRSVPSVTFETNRRAGISNKQEKTRRNLRLCFYILSCVEEETVYDKILLTGADVSQVKDFPEIDWEDIALELAAKGSAFQRKYSETQRLSECFSKMKLAPPLYAFDNQRFALDRFGKKGKTFDIVDVEKQKDTEQEAKDAEERIVRPKEEKAVVINDVNGRSLFSEEEYSLFDYRGDDFDESILGSKVTVEQYVAEAQRLRRHHIDYLQRLKIHISDRLSNYAGRSAENDPALLRKRRVSVAEEDFEDSARDYPYAMPGEIEETKTLKTVESISKVAYTSTLLDYMEFCAGRSVAVTDIEEQCNWFISRVHQIKESLKKIKLVAIGLIFAIIVLYIPFLVLQWSAITENELTVTIALLSIAVPIALVYLVFAVVSLLQRKKYRKAWKDFKEKSDRILEDNAMAAQKYDQLLSVYVPTLRWVYEYKLDVEFYAECCKMARAKIGHHIQKLHDRVVLIGNIIEDLEAETIEKGQSAEKAGKNNNDDIDYNVSFSSGKTNRSFYSIFDLHFLKSLQDKRGQD